MIICIPSLGRPKTKTHLLFEQSGHTVYHFLEPQEISEYDVENKVSIEASGKGIVYVRNFIKRWAKHNGHDYICVCDDDVNHFGKAIQKKSVKLPGADVLQEVFVKFQQSGVAVGGINQRQYAWSETKSYKINRGKVEQLCLLNLSKVSWDYDEYCAGKEDKDFVMQCIENKRNFVFFPKVFLSSPVIGSNNGGLNWFYSQKKDGEAACRLASKWPKYSKIIKQQGRVDCRLNYEAYAKDQGLKVV